MNTDLDSTQYNDYCQIILDNVPGGVQNITKRKEMEEELRKSKEQQELQLKLIDTLRPLSDPKEIKHAIAHVVGEYLTVDCAMYSDIIDNENTISIEDCYVRAGFTKITGKFPVSSFGAAMDVLRSGKPLIVENQAHTSLKEPFERESSTSLGIYASLTVPLIKEGKWVANFGVLHGSPQKWTENETAILQDAAERTWAVVERAKAEIALQESERKYRTLFEAIDDGFALIQPLFDEKLDSSDFMILECNSAWEHQTGFKSSKFIGKSIKHALPHLETNWSIAFARVARTGLSEHFEIYNEISDRWYNIHAFPHQSGLVGVLFRDITGRKQREEQKQTLLNAIQIERDRLSSLIRNMPDEVWFTDEHGNVILTNQVVHANFGTTFIGMNAAQIAESLEIYNPDGSIRPPNEASFLRAIKENKIINGEEIVRIPANNELSYRWFNAAPVRGINDKIIGAVAIIRDITKKRQMEEALRDSEQKALALVDKLERADKNKNEFINILSHELRNPLATITGAVQLLELKNKDEEALNILKMIKRQGEHLTKLVDDMLDITRISHKKTILRKEPANLNAIIKESIEDIKLQFKEKNIQLLENLCLEPITVNIDSRRITQCIGNILENALKFTGENGIVSISLDVEGKKATIRIQDNGIGINPQIIDVIFEPFKQDYNPLGIQNNKGIGLGLSIVKEYIEMHDGDVSASSQGLGKGSTFTLRLPII